MKFIYNFKEKYFELTFKRILLLLFTWFLVGFSMGTVTLMGPVRWVVNFGKSLQVSQSVETLLVKLVIITFVIFSFYTSLLLVRMMLKKRSYAMNISTVGLLFILTSEFTFLWMNPSLMQMGSTDLTKVKAGNVEFVFGPYPTRQDLIKLKDNDFTAVVSLLHTAVLPFEPKLIYDENETAKSIGFKLIHIPMLPWISDNKSSIEKIKKLAENATGKYYVHCYLGKDRVNVVKRIISQYSSTVASVQDSSIRKLTELGSFERGKIIELNNDVYVTPFPTDEEYFGYVLNGTFKKIVSLLNPNNPSDIKWINKEEEIVKNNLMQYELLPIKLKPFDANRVLEIANKVKQMQGRVVVHAFLTKSPQIEAFISAYETGLPSLPSYLFRGFMLNGKAELISPNILIGPSPGKEEFSNYLYYKGIRNVLFIGKRSKRKDKIAATNAGLNWFNKKKIDNEVINLIKTGGPWFVYGLSNVEMKRLLKYVDNKDDVLSVVN